MENMDTLSGDLPVARRVRPVAAGATVQLASEFKTAATAVSKLFNLGTTRLNSTWEEGYTHALRELLEALDANDALDTRTWVNQRLAELSDAQDTENEPEQRRRQYTEGMFTYDSSDDDLHTGEKRHRQTTFDTKRPRTE